MVHVSDGGGRVKMLAFEPNLTSGADKVGEEAGKGLSIIREEPLLAILNPEDMTGEEDSNDPGTEEVPLLPKRPNIQSGKLGNGAKAVGLKRVSFGSSKGSMVETLIYENPGPPEATAKTPGSYDSPDSDPGSVGGSRPASRVRVTFFESERPLAVSSPESDVLDFDLSNMTLPGSPGTLDRTPPAYNRQMSGESGWDNPFRPDGDLSKEADQIVELIKEGKPINDETLRSMSPTVQNSFVFGSPKGANGSAGNGGGHVEIQHGLVAPAGCVGEIEHVVIKKKKGCCSIQ